MYVKLFFSNFVFLFELLAKKQKNIWNEYWGVNKPKQYFDIVSIDSNNNNNNVLLCSSYIQIVFICVRTSFLLHWLIIVYLKVYKKN